MSEPDDGITVLHVDDDPAFTELTAAFLEREDDRFSVETATDVGEGFSVLDRTDVDCVVSDYEMPGRDGLEFLEIVREDRPDLPFVLFTGRGSEEVASDAISAGVTEYLQKERATSQYTVLANRIANAVERYRSKRALEASEKRLSLFIEQSPLGVIEWDDAFEVVRLNDAAEGILGYEEAELVGRGWEAIVPGDAEAAVGGVVDELLENRGGYHSVNENVTADGETIVCEWHNRVVTDGNEVVAVFSQFQDVTDRRRRREELDRYRTIVQSATNTILTVDESGTILSVNPAVERTFGYAPEEVVGESLTLLMSPEVADRHTAALERYLGTGERTLEWEYVELEGRRRDGSTVPLSVTFGEADYGGDRYFVGVIRDTTDRRARERELERTNALLSTLFETLPVGVLVEDTSRNVLAVNRRLLESFGMPGPPEAVVGADCERLAEEVSGSFAEPDGFLERTNELVADQLSVSDEEWRLRDGRTLARSHRSVELPEGEGHLWTYRDVTDRIERERRLAALSDVTRELVTADSREAVAEVGVSAADDILGLEAAAIHLYDERRDGLVPIAATDAVFDLVEGLPTFTDEGSIAWRVYREGEPVALDEVRNDPDVYNPETPVRSELYVPIGEFGILIAGSPTPEAFESRDVLLGEILAGNVAAALEQLERTEQLRDREAELSRQNERLEEFASIVSHDLRNPLNVASGRLELLAETCESEHVPEIERAHDQMADLIEELLDLARRGEWITETEPVELDALARGCWRTVATAEATVEIGPVDRFYADRSRLQQLLENLFRNAVEHGGETVTVTVGELDGGFYVADDGDGIPEDGREAVFTAGYSTSEDGSGFGLAIARQVADAHGWTVDVTEGREGGARFEITGVEFVDD